jgi:hypothetical protein
MIKAVGRESETHPAFGSVPGMHNSSEVKVLYPT